MFVMKNMKKKTFLLWVVALNCLPLPIWPSPVISMRLKRKRSQISMFVYNSVIYIWGGFQNNNLKTYFYYSYFVPSPFCAHFNNKSSFSKIKWMLWSKYNINKDQNIFIFLYVVSNFHICIILYVYLRQ